MIYIELFLAIGFLIHLVFLKLTKIVIGVKTNVILVIISLVIDSVYMLLYAYIPSLIEGYESFFVLTISITPFIKNRLKTGIIGVFFYFVMNFALGGIATIQFITTLNSFYVLIVLIVTLFILTIVVNYLRRYFKNDPSFVYDILIKYEGRNYYLKGYLDSGNFLCDDKLIPIVFTNLKIGSYVSNIKVNSVSTTREIPLYKIDYFGIKRGKKYYEKKVYVAWSEIHYDVMFGLDILEG